MMSGSDAAGEIRSVAALIDREIKAMETGDPGAALALLHDEAVFLPPNQAPKDGEALRQWLGKFIQRFDVQWLNFEHRETVVTGEFAFHRYDYTWKVTPKDGGESSFSHGKGIHVLKRTAEGDWKIYYEIWNSSPAPFSD